MPSVPPYSSTTIAMCCALAAHLRQRGEHVLAARQGLDARGPCDRRCGRGRGAARAATGRGCGRNRRRRRARARRPGSASAATRLATRARLTGIDPSRKVTSVRGTMTSSIERPPAAKTSSISVRSSGVNDSCAATSPRSSSSLIGSRPASGSPPSTRTTPLVDFDSNQMTGRKNGGQPVQRRREDARRDLGALQGQAFGREFAEHQRDEGDDQRDADDARGVGEPARPSRGRRGSAWPRPTASPRRRRWTAGRSR